MPKASIVYGELTFSAMHLEWHYLRTIFGRTEKKVTHIIFLGFTSLADLWLRKAVLEQLKLYRRPSPSQEEVQALLLLQSL